MKKIFILLILACIVGAAHADLTYGQAFFNNNKRTMFSTSTNGPLYGFIGEVENMMEVGKNLGTGKVFYVDSNVAREGDGKTWANAKDTLEEAINLCTANRGDVILIAQGHAETIDNGTSDAIDADVAGITIIGLGSGDDMPQFTYDTTTDEMVVNADGVTISGLRFLAGISEVANAIEIQAAGTNAAILDCVFPEPTTAAFEFNIGIQMVTAGNYATIAGNTFYSADAAGCESFIDGGAGVVVGYQIAGNYIYGSFDAAAIFSDQADLELLITQNSITNLESGDPCIEFTGNATGICSFNSMAASSVASSLDPGTFKCFENYAGDGTDSARITPPVADSTANYIGFNSSDNSAVTNSVVANENGSVLERLEVIQQVAVPTADSNNYFTVVADMTSVTWNTATAHEIAAVTGACRVQILIETTSQVVTVGTNGTMALGYAGNTAAIFSATALDDALTNDVWTAVYGSAATTVVGGADAKSSLTSAIFDVVVVGGIDVGYTIATNAGNTGDLTFHVWWTPLDATGSVTAGAGGPF